jgi:hypothetical protein
VTVQSLDGPYRPGRGPHVALPVHVEPGDAVLVHLSWDRVDCAAIDRHGPLDQRMSARGPLGVPVIVDVPPGEFEEPWSGQRTITNGVDPWAISWSAGVTEWACGRR